MSLSSILDSLARAASKRTGGPEELIGSNYDSSTYRYPLDIGNYDKGHYIVFHVNAQEKTQFNPSRSPDTPQAILDMQAMAKIRGSENAVGSLAEKLSSVGGTALGQAIKNTWERNTSAAVQDAFSGATADLKNLDSKFVRKIYRTRETVAMYMPDDLNFGYSQHFNEPRLSDSGAMGVGAFGNSMMDMIKKGRSVKDIGQNLSPFLYNYLLSNNSLLGSLGQPLFTAVSGVVQNPMIEVLYSSPELRSFNFTFMFYPRSEAEAREVQKIIDTFRFHMAPEIKDSTSGYFLVPPSEFDIKFMYFGQENPNIDKISTCVLQGMTVNYTQGGQWVAYEVEGQDNPTIGGTGTPVGIGMSLQFRETRIVTKESLRPDEAYFYNDDNRAKRVSDMEEQSRQEAEARYNEAGPTEADVLDYMERTADKPQSPIYAGGNSADQA